MAGFGDIGKKAQQFLKSEKVQETLKSEKTEGTSDRVLGGVADAVNKASGGKHADKVEKARDQADKRIGNE